MSLKESHNVTELAIGFLLGQYRCGYLFQRISVALKESHNVIELAIFIIPIFSYVIAM